MRFLFICFSLNAAQGDYLESLSSVPSCPSLHVLLSPDFSHLPGWPQCWGRSAPGHFHLCHLTPASSGEIAHDALLAFPSRVPKKAEYRAQVEPHLSPSDVAAGPILLLGNWDRLLWRYWWWHWTNSFLRLCHGSREARWSLDKSGGHVPFP